ncbi:toxin-activating lysine-acyltransferase [Mesorhizobium sp. B292B1B]|uniref:toxin-activating lysine-acyltransferase n=1 Tax=unclassified Mesorhizobium TaxID=325217 RepID=UPI001129BCEF|nr:MULTISPECIES: toxin-activating lysine-acyltransferase [unclassified Mesorhizobium]MCA0012083.1 toxin-activating lysine-acyltransferase [Mesorhizobium sp. B294B1A1]MCA0038337.1 toxin-activating lysine-acyltransferase [Mesorhizobium sp. B292B1B]TPM41175.1 toxin-activating lysine-acyltransferase [Mesorhizobium sp. B2-3-2]
MANEKSGNGEVPKTSSKQTGGGSEPGRGSAATAEVKAARPQLSAEAQAKLREMRSKLATAFSQVTMALMATPRYRNLSISDLEWLVLEPLLRDRIAIASGKLPASGDEGPMVGLAIWAKVSEAVGARIEEQARAGNFSVRLKGNDWDSGDIVWLLDVVAANRALATSVLISFGQLSKGAPVHVHPMVRQLVDKEILEKLSEKRAPVPS